MFPHAALAPLDALNPRRRVECTRRLNQPAKLTVRELHVSDVDSGNRSRVNESPHPARLGRGLDHKTHQTHSRADHPQALARRASAKQWTAEQLIGQGKTVADVCRVIELTQPT
jgi:hypothetical protein